MLLSIFSTLPSAFYGSLMDIYQEVEERVSKIIVKFQNTPFPNFHEWVHLGTSLSVVTRK